PGHGHILPHGAVAHLAHERRGDGYSGRRSVLGDGARRHVDVRLDRAKPILRDPQSFGVVGGEGERRTRGLLHHVAKLAGEDQAYGTTRAGYRVIRCTSAVEAANRSLHEHYVAAHGRVVHPRGDAHLVLLLGTLGVHPRAAQQVADLLVVHHL